MAKTRRIKKSRVLHGGDNEYGPDTPKLLRMLDQIRRSRKDESLELFRINITSLPESLPDNLTKLDCSNVPMFARLPQILPPRLKILAIANTQVSELPPLPSTLTNLNCEGTNITSLPDPLPPNLTMLNFSRTQISHIPKLPSSLRYLLANDTQITEIPDLPSSVEFVSIVNNPHLTKLSKLSPNLDTLYIYDNPNLTTLPELPSSLKSFSSWNTSLHIQKQANETIQRFIERNNEYVKKINKLKEQGRDLSAAEQTIFRPGTAATNPALQRLMNTNILENNVGRMLTGKSNIKSNVLPSSQPTTMQKLKKEATGRYGGRTKKNK